jgi:hypothetical protein
MLQKQLGFICPDSQFRLSLLVLRPTPGYIGSGPAGLIKVLSG